MYWQFSDIPAVVDLTGLETKSWVLLVWDQDKAEYKCGRDRDKTKTIKNHLKTNTISYTVRWAKMCEITDEYVIYLFIYL